MQSASDYGMGRLRGLKVRFAGGGRNPVRPWAGRNPVAEILHHVVLALLMLAVCLPFAGCESPLSSEGMELSGEKAGQDQDTAMAVDQPVVLELFTSQGCSSCPPADRLLSELHNEAKIAGREVIVLSHHVDYWNRLGWTDPYSSREASERQQYYVRALEARGSYTPQMVVDGRYETVGHRETEIRRLIRKGYPSPVPMQLEIINGKKDPLIRIVLSRSMQRDEELSLFLVQDKVENSVPAGENEGRHLHHDGVTLAHKVLKGERIFEVGSRFLPSREGQYRLIALLQSRSGIVGAVQIPVHPRKIR
ncbi:MAG: DUF1223 domain-containing protein [Leptospiraceae bacterium]|nr:DUF1223 domain-containing protein [Leptospiraceae bacterium]